MMRRGSLRLILFFFAAFSTYAANSSEVSAQAVPPPPEPDDELAVVPYYPYNYSWPPYFVKIISYSGNSSKQCYETPCGALNAEIYKGGQLIASAGLPLLYNNGTICFDGGGICMHYWYLSGGSAYLSYWVKYVNQPPVAVASASPNPAFVGEVVSFSSAGSYDPDGRIVAYRWEFGDGATSSEANTGHAYAEAGKYTVTLTVTDDKGATGSYLFFVKVTCREPTNVEPTLYHHYSLDSILNFIKAVLLRQTLGIAYIDNTVEAKIYGDLEFDKCISAVKGKFETGIGIIPYNPEYSFDRKQPDVYSKRVVFSAPLWILEEIIKGNLWFIEPDAYLKNITIIYKDDSIYPFSQNLGLSTVTDELNKLGWMTIGIYSPVDISLVDPLGREIGAIYHNGTLVKEIDKIPEVAVYTGKESEPEYIVILEPLEGLYKLRIHGTETGTYNLTIVRVFNKSVEYKEVKDNIPIMLNQEHEYTAVVDRTPPNVSILAPMNGSYTNSSIISWSASDNVGLGYFEPLVDGSSRKNVSALGNQKEGTFNTTLNLSDGLHEVEVRAFDLANNTASSFVSFTLDTTPPNVSAQYPARIADYEQFRIEANVSDTNLADVTFLQNSTPLNYSISGNTYSSTCLGPFSAGNALNYKIIAWDKAGNAASKEFNVTVVEGEVKIEGEGKNETVKLEFEAQWKKGEAKGELELQEKIVIEKNNEKEEKEKFKAHGKIQKLFKDCSGTFRISGTAKVEYGERKDKLKEKNVSFTGSVTENEIKILIDGREFIVSAKVNIKEKVEEEEGKK